MTVALLGECMIEMATGPGGATQCGYAGDTFNTALYLSRLGVPTEYITVLGDDPFSDEMLAFWAEEGVGASFVQRLAGGLPGLYVIRCDDAGERQFFYWRERAPVRQLFDLPATKTLLADWTGIEWLYLSGITLSLFAEHHLDQLLALLDGARAQNCRIAFDGNFRHRGWRDKHVARLAYNAVLARTDLAFPAWDDEQALFGDADMAACLARFRAHGINEVVLKRGAEPCVLSIADRDITIPGLMIAKPVDTTAAGDAFNAGYLAASLAGQPPEIAARHGHWLAGTVIQYRGAIIPRWAMPAPPTANAGAASWNARPI